MLTSHVAQLFLTDDAWASVLADLRRVLVAGGRARVRLPRFGGPGVGAVERGAARGAAGRDPVDVSTDVTAVDGPFVSCAQRFVFPRKERLSTITLRWRIEDDLRASLAAAGCTVDAVYGGWSREAVGHPGGELLVVADR